MNGPFRDSDEEDEPDSGNDGNIVMSDEEIR